MTAPSSRKPSAWVLCTGEPLPIDPGVPRLLRAGLLCERLVREGYDVDFWSSNFDHFTKRHRLASTGTEVRELGPGHQLRLLPSSGYARNVSLARVRDHAQVGRAFLAAAEGLSRPDVVVASMPTIDLASAAATYAAARAIPVVLDLRDLWPEIFHMDRPFPVGPAIRLLSSGWSRQLNRSLRAASAVVGITEEFVEWGCRRSGRVRRPEVDLALPLGYPPATAPTAAEAEAERSLVASGALRPGAFQLAFLGSVSHRMDLDTLCAAAVRAGEQGLPLHVVVAGSGEALKGLQDAYGSPNVKFLGRVDQTVLRAILRTSRAGVVPYRNSLDFRMSIPNKAIEYLAYGLPVLTSLEGSLARLVSERALGQTYVEGDPESLLGRVKEYLTDPALRDLHAQNARSTFDASFSTDVVFGKYVDLLERLIRGRR